MAQHDNLVTLAIFKDHNIRQIWHDDEWYFSVVDVVAALTESTNPSQYWTRMKDRVKQESNFELRTICTRLKLPANDGKLRETDCANTENMLHIVQYVPSKKALPFRQWLAEVGAERLEEMEDPETALEEWKERAIRSYMARGYSEHYAKNRVDSIIARKGLTGQWSVRNILAREIPILTDRLHMRTFGLSIQDHMELKDFPVIRLGNRTAHKGNLSAGLTPIELAVSTFADNITSALHVERDSHGFDEVARDVDDGGELARKQRLEVEKLTGKPVVSPTNMMIEKDGGLWSLLPPPEDS